MQIYRIYDNGGESIDRYTIVMKYQPWNDKTQGYFPCLGVDGIGGNVFSQWGSCVVGSHLGKQIKFTDLPIQTQEHVNQRLT